MQTFSLCLYGTQDVGFTYLLVRNGTGFVETDGPGSDRDREGIDREHAVANMTACVWHAVRHVRNEPAAELEVFLPNGRRLYAGTVGEALTLTVGDMAARLGKGPAGEGGLKSRRRARR